MSDDVLDLRLDRTEPDSALEAVFATLLEADPDGERTGRVFRATFDQLYDGQHTGRYRWDELFKTEKTHYGTLIEINLRREFADVIGDGVLLDYEIAGHEVDCKFSFRSGGWMLPPECFDQLLLVCTASDEKSLWSMGVVRATVENRRSGVNRDLKSGLNAAGVGRIRWLQQDAPLPPNVLLQVDPKIIEAVFAQRSGQARLNELFRRVTGRRIGRNTVATVAQQDDYMKRARANGGSRTTLAHEGYLIIGGDYAAQREVARGLGTVVPEPGEFVSVRVVPADADDAPAVYLDGQLWRLADDDEDVTQSAPSLPGR